MLLEGIDTSRKIGLGVGATVCIVMDELINLKRSMVVGGIERQQASVLVRSKIPENEVR